MRIHTEWLLTPDRAAIHLPTGTAVVADLHLGYDEARAASGEAVPFGCIEETIALLGATAARAGARRLLIAGDAIENRSGIAALTAVVGRLRRNGVRWIGLVPGNHDARSRIDISGLELFPQGLVLG